MGTLACIDGRYVLLAPKEPVPGIMEEFCIQGGTFQVSWGTQHSVAFSEATVGDLPEFRPLTGTVSVPVFASVEEADQWLTNLNA
jgi:hypothetical protein